MTASERNREARSLRETREDAWSTLRKQIERRQREWARRGTTDEERHITSAVATTYRNVLVLMDNLADVA